MIILSAIAKSSKAASGLKDDGKRIEVMVAFELVIFCFGYFAGHLFLGSQRYIVYPILILSVVANFIADRDFGSFFRTKQEGKAVWLFSFLLLGSTSFSMMYQGRVGFEDTFAQFVLIALNVAFAMYVIRYLHFSLFFLVGTIAVVAAIGLYLSTIPQEVVRGAAFKNMNTNAISAEMIWLVQLLYLSWINELDKKRSCRAVFFVPAALLFVVCVIAGGRSGMLCSGVLFIGVFVHYCRSNRVSLKVIGMFLAVAATVVWLVLNLSSFSNLAIMQNLIGGGLDSTGRDEIFTEYVDALAYVPNLIFGVDFQQLDPITFLVHPHNSYIQLHSFMGAVGFALVLVTMLVGIFRVSGLRIGVLLIAASFPIRIMTDSVCFFSDIDFMVYAFCLTALCSKSVLRKRKKEMSVNDCPPYAIFEESNTCL